MSQQIFKTPEQSRKKLQPSRFEKDAKAHSFWTVIVTKKNGEKRLLADFDHNVFPSVCIDEIHSRCFISTAISGSGFNFIALTGDTLQPIDSAQTSLTGEITTSGLGRVQATTRTHTNGTNSSLIEHTFTLDAAIADITRSALFNAITAGIMGPFDAFSNGATGPMDAGETVKVSVTVNTT